MSVYDDVLLAVIAMAQQTAPYASIIIGPLPPDNGLCMTWGSGAPSEIYLDKNTLVEMPLLFNGKHKMCIRDRQGLSTSLFAYYRPAIANNLDDDSPLGVSIYANALSTLKALDICYDSFVQEFRLGRKRIIVPAQCLRTVQDPVTNQVRRFFDATDEAYVALKSDDTDALKIQDNTGRCV